MTFYKSPFQELSYDEKNHIIVQLYFAQTAEMTEDLFKKELLQLNQFAEKSPVKGILADSREFLFPIHPDFQEWIIENIIGRLISLGLSKIATLLSEDFIAKMATEQIFEDAESRESAFQNRYFSNQEDAFAWLTEKS
jgi:hypothetical protein